MDCELYYACMSVGKRGAEQEEKQFYVKLKEIEKECEKASEKIGIRNVDLNTCY